MKLLYKYLIIYKEVFMSEDMKNKIIVTSIECFYQFGFLETTFKQIADKIGVTQPYLYNYFKNKMDLILECSIYAAEIGRKNIDSQIDEKLPARERLRQYLDSNLKWFEKERALGFCIISVYYFANTHDSIKSLFKNLVESSIKRLEIYIYQIKNEEKILLDNELILAKMVHNILIGEVYKTCLYSKKTSKENREYKLFLDYTLNLIR